MKSFSYVIKDPEGIHARPATLLIKEANKFKSTITIVFGEKKADCKRIFGVMGLGAKQGAELTFNFEGEDEEVAFNELKAFVEASF